MSLHANQFSKEEFENLKAELNNDGLMSVTVVSDSMEPIIMTGEEIVCQPLLRSLKPFDIILFFYENKIFCHMVLKVNSLMDDGSSILTGSYKSPYFDRPVAKGDILGVITSRRVSTIRRLLYLLKFKWYRR